MKKIELSNGMVAFVDDEDFGHMNQFRWHFQATIKTGYAYRHLTRGMTQGMHRLILELCDPQIQVDHKNRNGLDNRKENLRIATKSQNAANKEKYLNGCSSKYKGVSYYKRYKKWVAYIMVEQKHKHLGYFLFEEDAALAYNKAALEAFGEFACLNEV
jgi:hypothetical protein